MVSSIHDHQLTLRGAQIFDSTTGSVRHGSLTIEHGHIIPSPDSPRYTDVVDCTGLTLLPGFIDCHVHVTIRHKDVIRELSEPFGLDYYVAADNLRRLLEVGITTVRDAGGADRAIKEAVDTGLISGPRMMIAISMLSQTGGHADMRTPSGYELRPALPHPARPDGVVDGPERMRAKVRELIRAGADVIKVASSGGVLSPGDDPRHPNFQTDELEMAVREAGQCGRPVMAHALATEGIRNAVKAGVRSIEHGVFLDQATADQMRQLGVWLVPTLLATVSLEESRAAGRQGPATDLDRKLAYVSRAHRTAFQLAVRAGVPLAMGTDAVSIPMGSNLRELQLMQEYGGLSPSDVLRASTLSGANLLGLADQVGSLDVGKVADVVGILGDPFDFHDITTRIVFVIKGGAVVAGSLPADAHEPDLGSGDQAPYS
ncbi:MAG: amidohydrolase family protein [Candidatus Dormiibacterota bacterium]